MYDAVCLHQHNQQTWYWSLVLLISGTLGFPPMSLLAASEEHAVETYEWLSKGSSRIWRGSLANSDWRHLGKGAWAPKQGAAKRNKKTRSQQQQQPRGRPPKHRAQPASSKRSRPSSIKDGKAPDGRGLGYQ